MSGFLADLIEKCLERAATVVVAFALLAGVAATSASLLLRTNSDVPVYVQHTGVAASERKKFEQLFPNLDDMLTLRITGADPQAVSKVRNNVLSALQEKPDLFRQVFSPGYGTYYDTYALLHQDVKLLEQRVSYFRDLRPLLDVVSQSRTLGSISALTESVAAAANDGRNPQVFVDVYEGIARTVEAALNAKSDPVNWTAIAGLEAGPAQRSALLLAWPNPGKTAEALATLAQVQEQKSAVGVRLSIAAAPVEETASSTPTLRPYRLAAAAAIALIMIALILFVLSHNPAFVGVVFCAWIFTLCMWAGCLVAMPLYASYDIAALVVAAGFSLALLANAGNAVLLSAGVKSPRGMDSVDIMGRDAARRLAVPFVFLAAFLGCAVYASRDLLAVVLAISVLTVLTVLSAVLLLPVLWQYVRDWKVVVHSARAGSSQARLLVVLIVGLIAMASQVVLLPQSFKQTSSAITPPPNLSVLASSRQDAERLVGALRTMPEVKGARWLDGFLPENGFEKQALVKSLDVTLPEPGTTDPDPPGKLAEDAKKLEAALTAVSLAGGADSAMKAAALAARRSLTAVLETNSTSALPHIERDLFVGLEALAERLSFLSNLRAPEIADLDPAVTAMFRAGDGTYRIEVEPVDGVSANGLALTLASRSILPVSRAVELQDQRFQHQRTVFVFLGIGMLAGFLLLMLARADHMRALMAGLATVISIAVTVFMFLITKSALNEPLLALALTVLGCIWGQAALSPMSELFRPRRNSERRPVDFVHWLLPLSAGAVALSLWLVGEESFALQSLAITAILLQAACLQAAVAMPRSG